MAMTGISDVTDKLVATRVGSCPADTHCGLSNGDRSPLDSSMMFAAIPLGAEALVMLSSVCERRLKDLKPCCKEL